ncbi:MAG: Clp protease ClpS [Sphingobacteriaceae bacterium]|nr:Clp protease ClpS [Sphingobacteriaceae bacterium]
MNWTGTFTQESVDTDVLELEERAIVLYNDEVNTFDHVIECLIKYCGHDAIQAEQCAWITHLKGKCKVKQGEFEKLLAPCDALQQQGLNATIE